MLDAWRRTELFATAEVDLVPSCQTKRQRQMKRWLARNKGFIVFLLCFGVFRTAVADWNPIPSGSMRPTLLEGDVVFVNRLAYNIKLPLTDIVLAPLGDPQRGDIVTFSSPRDGTRLIKRIVGLPGDRIQVKQGQLYINGTLVPREPAGNYTADDDGIHMELHGDVLTVNGMVARYDDTWAAADPVAPGRTLDSVHATEHLAGSARAVQFLPEVRARRDMAPLTVPAGHYFMLGDNRDNSEDSRYIGVVPRKLLIGRANHIVVSADVLEHWQPRFERVGKALE
jgi:signal peptidase I